MSEENSDQLAIQRGEEMRSFRNAATEFSAKYGYPAPDAVDSLRSVGASKRQAEKAVVEVTHQRNAPVPESPAEPDGVYTIPLEIKEQIKREQLAKALEPHSYQSDDQLSLRKLDELDKLEEEKRFNELEYPEPWRDDEKLYQRAMKKIQNLLPWRSHKPAKAVKVTDKL